MHARAPCLRSPPLSACIRALSSRAAPPVQRARNVHGTGARLAHGGHLPCDTRRLRGTAILGVELLLVGFSHLSVAEVDYIFDSISISVAVALASE